MKELETIEYCFKEVAKNYQDRLYDYTNQNKCLLLVADLHKTLKNLLVDYQDECQKFPTNDELKIYEKAACLAMSIKNNVFYAVSDQFNINIDTSINIEFAIDVALKFCENSLQIKLFDDFSEEMYSYVQYTILLLVDILECKNAQASIISESMKKQLDLLTCISKLKVKI